MEDGAISFIGSFSPGRDTAGAELRSNNKPSKASLILLLVGALT